MQLHEFFKGLFININVIFQCDLTRQIDREAERIVQLKDLFTGDFMRAVLDRIAYQIRKNRKACINRRVKALFLHADDLFDVILFLGKLRISTAVVLNHHIAKLRKKRMVNAEQLAVTGGTADDAAKHIAAAFVGRNDAVANHKRGAADMVGNHAD